MNLDDELKNAFRRQEAPPGFAGRVLARAAQKATSSQRSDSGKVSPFVYLRALRGYSFPLLARWVAAGALCTAVVVGGIRYRNIEREKARQLAAGEAAKQHLMLALRIAGSKLQLARAKVHEINDDGGANRHEKE